MDEVELPRTDPGGALEPPRRDPPTAVAASGAPLPEPISGPVRWLPRRRTALGEFVERALDTLDAIGDRVRDVLVR
jgi:hypothetical protein